jgi:GTP:adenosylcobinamide-phosphate guanylyltransferase
MDAIVTAGGIPLPEEPLYLETKGRPKALLDVAGKPMIQWILDALSGAKQIENVIIVGLTEKSGVKCRKPLHYVPNQGKMLDNFRAGVEKAFKVNKKTRHVLFVSADIPSITAQMIDWVVSDEDIYYNIIQREVMEKRFPGSRRTYTHLKGMEVCGGDMNVVRAKLVSGESGLWEKITNARKSPLKQASLIGFDTLFLLLFRQLELDGLTKKVTKRLNITGHAILCPYAEVGMDVDKPHQLDLLRKDLQKQLRKKTKPAAKKTKQTVKKAKPTAKKTKPVKDVKKKIKK